MKYASIDIETTGLDPESCDVLEIAVVLDDLTVHKPIDQLPVFHSLVSREEYRGQPRALAMHARIFEELAKKGGSKMKITSWQNLLGDVKFFLSHNGYGREERLNVAGKNFASFDARFLSKLPEYENLHVSHRVIEPAMLFWNPFVDKGLPDTKTCYERAGLTEEIAHTALDDARGIVKLLRRKFWGANE